MTITIVGSKDKIKENIFLSLGQVYNADFSKETDTEDLKKVVVSGLRQDKIINNSRTGSQEVITRTQIE